MELASLPRASPQYPPDRVNQTAKSWPMTICVLKLKLSECILVFKKTTMIDNIAMSGNKAAFCISHIPPFFSLPKEVNLIQTARFESEVNSICLPELIENWADYKIKVPLVNYAVPYLGKIAKDHSDSLKFISVMLHRKICTVQPIGFKDTVFDGQMWLAAGESVEVGEELNRYPEDLLIPMPIFFNDGIIGQYARCHIVQDFWRLVAICVDVGLFNSAQAMAFCSEKVLCWGAPLGQLPLKLIILLADVQDRFLKAVHMANFKCTLPDDGLQGRCLAFFSERLMGYFVLQYLLEAGKACRLADGGIKLMNINIGHCCTVGPGNIVPESYVPGRG